MAKYPKTVEDLTTHAFRLIERVMKKLNAPPLKIKVSVKEGPKLKGDYTCSGYFVGNPKNISNSLIELDLYHYDILSGSQQLRRWNAAVVILFLHEYAHYLIFKKLGVSQRKEAIRKYSAYNYYEEKEEGEAWQITVQLLKKLGYHKRKTIAQEIKKFELPKGFKVRF